MKIGIITIQKCNNFGADLQAFALQKKLLLLGYEAENIDYVFYKNPRHLNGNGEKPAFRLSAVNRVKEALFPIFERVRKFKNRRAMSERAAKFDAWFSKNVRQSAEYRSVASLYAARHDYDVYMVGSDQVWNPRMGSNIKPYFLDFAPEGARCVSYAASIGTSSLSSSVYAAYHQWLERFSSIGVREKSAERIVGNIGLNAEVKQVVDPTLLLTAEEWAVVADEPAGIPAHYVLLYDLIASLETTALAQKIAAEKGLPVVRVGDGAYGPGEFIWLFAHANIVVTNSFHGTAFSLIYKKDFYSVIPSGMTNAARIESVLKLVGASDRLIRAEDVACFDSSTSVDWLSVSSKLDAAREDSVDFLKRAVEGLSCLTNYRRPLDCYAFWHNDTAVRAASTSGGLFSALAREVIAKGGVVYGAAFDADFKHVHHRAARTLEELRPLLMSKYVYSDATDATKEAVSELKAGKAVLFAGTPCQVAVMSACAKDYAAKLITIDIVCHGTPRPEVFTAYVEEMERKHGGHLTRYEFRNKDRGWNFPSIVSAYDNGRVVRTIPWHDKYFHGYSINAFLRDICYVCPYAKLERPGDFTIGDCWRVATSHPQYDDGKGTSMLFVNTKKARAFWRDVQLTASLSGGVYDVELARLRNMPLMEPAVRPPCARSFARIFKATSSFEKAAATYATKRSWIRNGLVYLVKRYGWFYFRRHQ